ncbi:MAG: peptidoglycan editing factor PgeF [Pseudomonadota bacterium]|nr:peptidoglycan editing factor PgeF [Pseudomonadota bacterium]
MTTRRGGFSTGLFDSMNLRDGLGDDVRSVALNQRRLSESIGVSPIYLNQVHGHRVVRLTSTNAAAGAPRHEADACMTTEPGVVCAVQVADCMPVLFAAPGAVAAAHAGWRGLAAGILDTTLDALCLAAGCVPGQVEAWLGPCIGPRRFEVGADVLQAFGCTPTSLPAADDPVEAPRFTPTKPGKWLANLPRLARERLVARGVVSISGGTWCSVEEASRFFSFRRDGVTGRMVAAIWLTV